MELSGAGVPGTPDLSSCTLIRPILINGDHAYLPWPLPTASLVGPTPGFAHEDEQENAFYATRAKNEATKERILVARRTIKLLNLAQTSLTRAQRSFETAKSQVEDSILFFDDAFQSLQSVDERITHALLTINRAEELLRPLSPQIVSTKQALIFLLSAAKISTETFYSRDSILSAVASAQGHLSEAESNLRELVEIIKQRERDALSDIRGTARQLEDTRQELQHVRQGIFEKVAGFGEAAPAYNECCDRAETYCTVPEERNEHELEHVLEHEPEIQVGRQKSHDAVIDRNGPPGYEN